MKKLFLIAVYATVCIAMMAVKPLDGGIYKIQHIASGQVLSNASRFANDVPIVYVIPDSLSRGQVWHVKTMGNFYYFLTADENHAIDFAPTNSYKPVLWSYSATNANQRFGIREVNGMEDVFQIYCGTNLSMILTRNSSGGVQMMPSASGEETYFRFVETTDVEDNGDSSAPVWENERIFGINKEGPHATFIPYSTVQQLQDDKDVYAHPWLTPTTSSQYLNLNGKWKFLFAFDTNHRPTESFYADNVDCSDWAEIDVPGCWEMFGYDKPMYINVNYAFDDTPPYINNKVSGVGDNPVGSYRRNFTLPRGWQNQRVFFHSDGLYSAAFVWVNGQAVGYTQGGNNDAEFDITQYVREGENNISIQVLRWSDGSYLEGQDMWRMSGLHRDVYLYATPKTYLRDHYITAELAPSTSYKSGKLKVELQMINPDGLASNKSIQTVLLDPQGNEVKKWNVPFAFAASQDTLTAYIEESLSNLQLWSAEQPNLYTFLFSQLDEQGREEMAFQTKYGFRDISIKSYQVLLNGNRVFFKGVNTQDTHPTKGRSIDVEYMLKDIVMMKQANVNTVRTSHYPRQPKMMAMFDYYGIYVMDEADVECHKNWGDGGKMSDNPSWQPQYIDRTERMVYRDRNHPSVIFWSLGNESGTGRNFQATYNRCKNLDTRPVHYEGATNAGITAYTDLNSKMYPDLNFVRGRCNSASQPFFMCEYAHAMGNAVGNLKDYWEIIEASPRGIGGCIWDWVDQSIYPPQAVLNGELEKNGFPYFVTGYDFPGPHQGNFINNGIITADRCWTPKLTEVKKVYQPVGISYGAAGRRVTMTNKNCFTNLADVYYLHVEYLDNQGIRISENDLDIPSTQPNTKSYVSLVSSMPQQTAYVNIEIRLKENTPYAEAGYPVATEQIVINATTPKLETPNYNGYEPLTVTTNGLNTNVGNTHTQVTIHYAGYIRKLVSNGITIIDSQDDYKQPIYSNIRWIENESPYGTHNFGNRLAEITSAKKTTPVLSEDAMQCTWSQNVTDDQCSYTIDYTLYASGELDMAISYNPQMANLRRIGIDMRLPAGFEDVEYFGRGPWENYIDRQSGSYIGRYQTTVNDLFESGNVHPQSNGNRMDMRSLTLTNAKGEQFCIETEGSVNFSLSHYDQSQFLSPTIHTWQLRKDDIIYATFDYMQRGLGNGSCGPGTESLYTCPSSGTYQHTLRFYGLDGQKTSIQKPVVNNEEIYYDIAGHKINPFNGTMRGLYLQKNANGVRKIMRK